MDYSQYTREELIAKLDSQCTKEEIIAMLKKIDDIKARHKQHKELPPKYKHLPYIRNEPQKVEVTDTVSGEKKDYPSLYKAGKALGAVPRSVQCYDGRLFKGGKYFIRVFKALTS